MLTITERARIAREDALAAAERAEQEKARLEAERLESMKTWRLARLKAAIRAVLGVEPDEQPDIEYRDDGNKAGAKIEGTMYVQSNAADELLAFLPCVACGGEMASPTFTNLAELGALLESPSEHPNWRHYRADNEAQCFAGRRDQRL